MIDNIDIFISCKGDDTNQDGLSTLAIGHDFATKLQEELKKELKFVNAFLFSKGEHKQPDFLSKIKDSISSATFYILILGKREYWEEPKAYLKWEWENYDRLISPAGKLSDSYIVIFNNNKSKSGVENIDFLPSRLKSNNFLSFNRSDLEDKKSIKEAVEIVRNFYKKHNYLVTNFEKLYEEKVGLESILAIKNSQIIRAITPRVQTEVNPLYKINGFNRILNKISLEGNLENLNRDFIGLFNSESLDKLNTLRVKLKALLKFFGDFNYDPNLDDLPSLITWNWDKDSQIVKEFIKISKVDITKAIESLDFFSSEYEKFFNCLDFYFVSNFNKTYEFTTLIEIYSNTINLIIDKRKDEVNTIEKKLFFLGIRNTFLKSLVQRLVVNLHLNDQFKSTKKSKKDIRIKRQVLKELQKTIISEIKSNIKPKDFKNNPNKTQSIELTFENNTYSIELSKPKITYCLVVKLT
jgi:hypothetical protein